MIIAIDFDGTIVENEWPEIGEPKWNVFKIINKLQNEGHTLILNTCREGILLKKAQKFLKENDVYFEYINSNSKEKIEKYYDARKIGADIYIDDLSLGGIPDDWAEIYRMINERKT